MKKKAPKRIRKKIAAPKTCAFCVDKKEPWFGEIKPLQKFTADRGKIYPRSRSGLCAKHQRRLALSIKHARHLSLMPFIVQG